MSRCEWCAIALTWRERVLRFFYMGHCGTCRAALDRNDPGPPFPRNGRRSLCRKYLSDHEGYCAGHHAEAYAA